MGHFTARFPVSNQPPLVVSYDTHGEKKNGGPIMSARAHKAYGPLTVMYLFYLFIPLLKDYDRTKRY